MAFKFRLKQVLEYRRGKEEEAKSDLARKQHQLQLARHRLHLFQREKENMEDLWREQERRPVDVRELNLTWHYHQHLDRKARQQEESCQKLKQQEEKKRQKVKSCWQRRRIMEMLEEKNWQRYLWDLKKAETKRNDEISLFAHYRKGGEN